MEDEQRPPDEDLAWLVCGDGHAPQLRQVWVEAESRFVWVMRCKYCGAPG